MPSVKFFDEEFELAGEFSEFALMEFAEAADDQDAENAMHSMASMLRLVLDCLTPGEDGAEHKRFRAVARKNRAKATHLMDVLKAAMEAATERPTGQASDSSDGPLSIEPKSGTDVADRVVRAFPGRPDRQVGVMELMGVEETG